jgi:hypothetical protein
MTTCVIQGETIIPYRDADCIGNKALFFLIGSRVDAYFQRAIRKFEGKGDQALLYIKNHCDNTTADDTHHFHHLFTSIRIKENESATNYFCHFSFAWTEAEGVGNTYSEQSLVNFALAGLITSKNPKYDTAVQLFNLERDNGKVYSLEDIEKKFFAIDEKTGRETASARIALGNVAMGQRGDRTHHNTRNPHRTGHRKPECANAATDSNRYANVTCYNCGRKGQIAPTCPDKKNGKSNAAKSSAGNSKSALGNAARSTTDLADNSPELVCLARDIAIPRIRPPQSGPAAAITMVFEARELDNVRIFVSLVIRVDESVFSWERERSLNWGHLPELYTRNLDPMEEPVWVMSHNRPLHDLEPRCARITYPDHKARIVFTDGIIPGLKRGFSIEPHKFPKCYRFWHSLVKAYIEFRLENIDQGLNLPVTVGVRNRTIVLTFYPIRYPTPELISMGPMEYIIHPADSDEEWEQAFMAISKVEAANIVRKMDPTIAEIGDPRDLNNYLPDSGATQHMTLQLADLVDAVEGQNLGMEVADRHVIKCTTTGKIKVKMLDDNGDQLEVTLADVMYVPGLSRRLFSVSKFARHGFHAMIKRNATTLYFHGNGKESPITLQSVGGGKALAADLRIHAPHSENDTAGRYHSVPSMRNRDHSEQACKFLSLETLHNQLGHRKCRTLLVASEHNLWADTGVLMTSEVGCLDRGIATIRATARNKHPHTAATRAGEHLFSDIQYAVSPRGLTHATTFPNYLLIVDAYSRYSTLYVLAHKSSTNVITALKKFQADHSFLRELGHLDTEKIRADAGG